jgi:peptidoglycan/xylan/chitin deacetylase (PgdA/CDA1 family)
MLHLKRKLKREKILYQLGFRSLIKSFRHAVFWLITVEQKKQQKKPQLVQQSLHMTRSVILNPLVIVLSLVGLLLFGWTQYTNASHDFSLPTGNLLPGNAFNVLQGGGVPTGWQLIKDGQLDDTISYQDGYVSGRSLVLTVNHYQSGDLELVTPKVAVNAQTSYLFKGFYTTSANFDLLLRYYYKNGTSQLRLVHSYQSTSGIWTTDSMAFKPDATVTAVQFMYRIGMNGQLQLDNTYLEPSTAVYVPPSPTPGTQLLANADLSNSGSSPQAWTSYKSGSNDATFAYTQSSDVGPDVSVVVKNYKNGEAKWQPDPFPVTPGQYYQFSFSYTGTSQADVVAEYEMQNGSIKFNTAETISPASEWTNVTVHFDVPAGATSITPCVIMHNDGTLKTAKYSLYDETKLHPVQWTSPLISLTFDDGHVSQYVNGSQQLRADGLNGTFYINPATVDTNSFMSTSQLTSLQQSGDEIASHGYSTIDLTTVNAARINAELQGSESYLSKQFGVNPPDVATSDSNSDPQVSIYARKYYASLRGIEGGINTKQNLDPYNLKVFYVTNYTSVATIESAISQAKAYNGWLIFVYHQIGVSSTNSNADISLRSFQSQLHAIKASGVPVKTVTNALVAIGKQQ